MAAQRVRARPRVGFAVTHPVPIAGPEDITIDQAAGRASMVAQDRWSTKENTQLPGIYVLDLTSDTTLPERLSADLSGDFKGSVRGLAAISMLCTLAGTRDLPCLAFFAPSRRALNSGNSSTRHMEMLAPKLSRAPHRRATAALASLANKGDKKMPLDKDLAALKMRVIVRDPPIEVPGPEDIVIDHAASLAFVASQQRMSASGKMLDPDDIPGGSMFALDLKREPLAKRLLADQASLSFPFHPRGCSLFTGKNGERRLMVISDRTAADHVVEIFDVVGEAFDTVGLRHVRTIVDTDHLISPNDLVALDGDRFYVANDHGARTMLLRSLEDLWGLPLSTVVFWDGRRCHTVAQGIVFANGMALDHARGRLYVAATRSKKINVYEWDASDPAKELAESDSIALPGCPDNLEWDEEGHLWMGADPSFVQLALYAAGVHPTAPSQVLCLSFDQEDKPHVKEVWRDETGQTISASSVAAVHGKGPVRRLLIGQPWGNFLRDCELVS